MLNDTERANVRCLCGYPPENADVSGFQNWRFYQARGLLEFRLNYLTGAEEAVVRRYLDQLGLLEAANAKEPQLFDGWRRRLCGFLGIPPGPEMEKEGAP